MELKELHSLKLFFFFLTVPTGQLRRIRINNWSPSQKEKTTEKRRLYRVLLHVLWLCASFCFVSLKLLLFACADTILRAPSSGKNKFSIEESCLWNSRIFILVHAITQFLWQKRLTQVIVEMWALPEHVLHQHCVLGVSLGNLVVFGVYFSALCGEAANGSFWKHWTIFSAEEGMSLTKENCNLRRHTFQRFADWCQVGVFCRSQKNTMNFFHPNHFSAAHAGFHSCQNVLSCSFSNKTVGTNEETLFHIRLQSYRAHAPCETQKGPLHKSTRSRTWTSYLAWNTLDLKLKVA